jgi:exodeoxyribonuclease V beta subunit
MSLQRIREEFDVYRVPLEDTNLIEASAGTGKTHSVALLALRLILEKEIGVEQILMVTFTIDAAAEMNVRVRKFLRDANNYLRSAAGDADSGRTQRPGTRDRAAGVA